ncbi:MAG: sulfatase [Planctomycetota bacterium]
MPLALRRAALVASAVLAVSGPAAKAADRPNVLWLSAEDISCHLGCYGDPVAKTPTLDALAATGVRYDNAFTNAPVCAVMRSGVITGAYPVSIGTHHMRCRVELPSEIVCFTRYLRAAGYYCTNNSKEDYNFRPSEQAWDASSNDAHWRDRPAADRPFFAVFNYMGTHEGRVRGDKPAYPQVVEGLEPQLLTDPADVTVAPYHPDTPRVRAVYARSYNTIAALDRWVAGHLESLEDAGLTEDTIVVFWSDHGTSLPRGKRWLYDSGVKIPLVVRVPEKWRKLADPPVGNATDELVSSIDFAPTMLNLAGLPIPGYMAGRAFLGPDRPPERADVFLHRDRMDERYEMSRAVRTPRYKYIRNYTHWRPWTQWMGYAERSPVMKELRRLKAEGSLTPEQALWMADYKPVEELYDLEDDPHELVNLAGDVSQLERLRSFRSRLREQMIGLGDLGVLPESELARLGQLAGTQSEIVRRLFDDRAEGLLSYAGLVDTANLIATPGPPMGRAGRDVFFAGGIANPKQPGAPTAAVWGLRAWLSPAIGRRETGSALVAAVREGLRKLGAEPQGLPAIARVSLAELYIERDATDAAVPLLVGVAIDRGAGFARVEALNALDLLPDLDAFADQLRPAAGLLRKDLRARNADPTVASYLRRCVGRLVQRVGG